MVETLATVVRTEGGMAYVETTGNPCCGQCKGQGCGSSGGKPRQFKVENPISAAAGDRVILTLSGNILLQAVVLLYLIPLVGLIVGAATGIALTEAGDAAAVVGGVLGLGLGLVLARRISHRMQGAGHMPRIARLAP